MNPQEIANRNTLDAIRGQEVLNRNREMEAAWFSAAEQQRQLQWQAREEKRLSVKQFYGVLVTDLSRGKDNITWVGGYPDEDQARKKALEGCGTSSCAVVASFVNTCAMLAQPDGNKKIDNIFVATDKNPDVAIKNALTACDAKFGKGACYYNLREEPVRNKAYCTGFNYGVYKENPWYQFW